VFVSSEKKPRCTIRQEKEKITHRRSASSQATHKSRDLLSFLFFLFRTLSTLFYFCFFILPPFCLRASCWRSLCQLSIYTLFSLSNRLTNLFACVHLFFCVIPSFLSFLPFWTRDRERLPHFSSHLGSTIISFCVFFVFLLTVP
jgi:hypothetical protein